MTDLTAEQLDELERKYANYAHFNRENIGALIAMARDKQAAEQERDALRVRLESWERWSRNIDSIHFRPQVVHPHEEAKHD